jgi:glycosyltransferase involved in cell wall biosynthesis
MAKRITVLRIQHNFVEPTNQRLLDELARFPELDVHALCPVWGVESGNKRVLRRSPRPDLEVGRTIFTYHYATTFYVQKLAAAIRRLKPDVLNIHDEPWSLTTAQALFYRRLYSPRSKVVFCSAQNIYKKYPYPFGAIERANYRAASFGYGCCGGVRDVVREKGYTGPFEVIPLGLDPELFSYRRREGRIEGRPFVIGYVGRIVEEKGVFTLLRAFAGVKKANAHLVFLGCGPDEERVRAEAAATGVADRIEFLPPMPHVQVPAAIDRFDVLVVPSETTPTWKEQFGRVIVEAFSMGVPVIGSDSGSVPEVVGDAGLIFKEKDHGQLAGLIESLIQNPERLPEMSGRGRARALAGYTWGRVAEMYRSIYLSVAEQTITKNNF